MYALVKCAFVVCAAVAASGFALSATDVVFHVFSRNNPTLSEPLLPSLTSMSTAQNLILSRRTVFTIHGHGETASGNMNAFLLPAHLAAEDVNYIAVDWSNGASLYTEGLGNAPQAGQVIADFINILVGTFMYGAENIRIVGHGLGGHIAGIAARKVNGNIPHIISLDPTLTGWTYHPEQLNANDAGVVEVLHATAGTIGYDTPLGDLDFYANGGLAQPGCGTDSSCSHIYAYAFYAESLTAEVNEGLNFVGTQCESYEQVSLLQCAGDKGVIFGGTATKTTESGIYVFSTNFVEPFATG